MTFIQLQEKFPTQEHVIQHFIKIRYNNQVCCNHCASVSVVRRADKPKVFRCNDCFNDFSIFKDTMFEDTYTDLRKWMYALHLFINGKKGIAALQLMREIGGSYKTSWRMLHRIRSAMGNKGDVYDDFRAIIEIDEAYVGGAPRKENKRDKATKANTGMIVKGEMIKRGRGTKKVPIVGLICRASNQVHAKVAYPGKTGKKLTGKQLKAIIDEVVNRRAIFMTDQYTGYNFLSKSEHAHFTIDHSKEYAKGSIHTNNIESFWATLKRGLHGIYHQVSPRYLQQYINEFCFRYNNRKNPTTMDLVLLQSIKR